MCAKSEITRRALFPLVTLPWQAAARTLLFEQVDLFHQGDNGVHTYRIPALIETRKGTLLAMVDARHDSGSDLPARISLVLRKSTDRGRTWSKARMIVAPAEGGVGDASLLLDRHSGRVWCFHAFGPPGIGSLTAKAGVVTGPDTLQVHTIWSDDDGETWSQAVDLTPQMKDPAWQSMFATSGTHFQTSRGRFLVPMAVRVDGKFTTRNAYSDDAGKHWKIGPEIAKGTDESKAVELADGTVLENLRNGKTRLVARSHDGGVTFDAPSHDEALIDPGCNAGLARYRRDGHDWLIFTNAAAAKRENLCVKLSSDNGRTWMAARTIHAGPAAYSTVIVLRDGSIGVLYERGEKHANERITFARFSPAWAAANNLSTVLSATSSVPPSRARKQAVTNVLSRR